MALAMARPWKHPSSGVYWLRRRVPDDLREVLGKREEKLSLRTRDIAEAKMRHVKALADLDARWANLRKGPSELTERQAHDLASAVHDRMIQHFGDNPSETFWDSRVGETLWQVPKIDVSRPLDVFELDAGALARAKLEDWCRTQADVLLRELGQVVDEISRVRLERAIGFAAQRASLTLERFARGEYDASHLAAAPAVGKTGSQINTPVRLLSMTDLVDAWAAERRPAAKTAYMWRNVADQLTDFLGRTDVSSFTPDDLVRWKAALVDGGLKAKTIKDGKLAPIRALLQWAVDNRLLNENVAERVTINAKLKPSETRRGYTEPEARRLLLAAQEEAQPVRRWIPWLCAYSGARVAELCQLRAEDVFQDEGVWCLRLTPEAGALKNVSSERTIPIHSALIASGFLDFVTAVKSGPLFTELSPDRFGSRGGNGTKVLSRWIRSLGMNDPRISPNHSWRHRLKTLARRHGLALDIVDAISGHQRGNVGDAYGEFPAAALSRELEKIPPVDLSSLSTD
ncbi:hypothetical protein JNW90_28085 [Micromonospora sp. STR1s_5]|nr:hypothetical protein [Micromonospora sp. STR1s_5]